jgi:hypothetical protein
MSDLSDAIKALEEDAQSLRDNLPNLSDPPAADQLKIIEGFISAIQERLDRLREVIAAASTTGARRKRRPQADSGC